MRLGIGLDCTIRGHSEEVERLGRNNISTWRHD